LEDLGQKEGCQNSDYLLESRQQIRRHECCSISNYDDMHACGRREKENVTFIYLQRHNYYVRFSLMSVSLTSPLGVISCAKMQLNL